MSYDLSDGIWTVDVEGVGKNRKVFGVIWAPDRDSRAYVFNCSHQVVICKDIRIGKMIVPRGTLGIIVSLIDPTLSPKHHSFIEVYFDGSDQSVWLGVADVTVSSYSDEDEEEDYSEEFEIDSDKTPPTVH